MTAQPSRDFEATTDALAYKTIFANAAGNGTFMVPGGTTSLKFDSKNAPQTVTLNADPGMALLATGMFGAHVMLPEAALLEFPDIAACFNTLTETPSYKNDPTGAGFGGLVNGVSKCIDEESKSLTPKDTSTTATKSLGAILSMVQDGGALLFTNVQGALGPLTGQDRQVINVRTQQKSAAAGSGSGILTLTTGITSNGAGFVVSPNHFRVSDRYKHGGRYYADVAYHWAVERPAGSDLGYCKYHVRVTRADGSEVGRYDSDNFNGCSGGGGYGTNTELTDPGLYTVTVDIEMEKGPPLHAVQQFTLDQ
ncbi:hypothetical protein SAMN05445060_2785 [Williamsia sterculiae]|uniref:Uncharacterized protein n=2 Tax=Williamsia sterculiae TaxID=1344003 RepID=A0A1N7GHF6_9NOCA|nr:hypothetical protein SAMN05445060_2785 [Williamsia sterculiae]